MTLPHRIRLPMSSPTDNLHSFRDGHLSAGLETGVNGLLACVIDQPCANTAARTDDATQSSYIMGGIAAAIGGHIELNRSDKATFAKEARPVARQDCRMKTWWLSLRRSKHRATARYPFHARPVSKSPRPPTPSQCYARRGPRAAGSRRGTAQQANGSPPRRTSGLKAVKIQTTRAPLLSTHRG